MRSRKWISHMLKVIFYFTLTWIALFCVYQLNVENQIQASNSGIIAKREDALQNSENNNKEQSIVVNLDANKFTHKDVEETRKILEGQTEREMKESAEDEDNEERMNEEFKREMKDHEKQWINDMDNMMRGEGKELKESNRTSYTFNENQMCERKTRIVYIKTHKTGSCTTTNMLYRFALKYDVPTLQFTFFPYPTLGIYKFYIHTHKFLEETGKPLTQKFQLAADHMRYEREEFDKIMDGDIFYTTTLRNPPDHLRSVFSYFDVANKLGMSPNITDPVEEYIMNKAKYPNPVTLVENRNADNLGFDRKDSNDPFKVADFIHKMDRELGLVMITEYSSESYILLRRKMCWDMSDVLYLSINNRKYKNKGSGLSDEALRLHKQWNNVDYIMYDHYNKSLWNQIDQLGQDFQDELTLYRKYLDEIKNYCDPLVMQIHNNKSALDAITRILNHVNPLTFPRTKYGREFEIDIVWCTLSRINIMEFYNIMRAKQFPALCDFLSLNAYKVEPHQFRISSSTKTVNMWSGYCAKNDHNTLVPLESIAGSLLWWARKMKGG